MQLWEPHHIPGNRAKWTGTVRFEGVAGTGADGQLLSHTSCAITRSPAQPRFLLANNNNKATTPCCEEEGTNFLL